VLDLTQCDKTCLNCIKGYKSKHKLVAGQKFKIKCTGIPDYEQLSLFGETSEQDTALSVLDPVRWAAETLDWHCLDPDGEIWKRKNPEEYNEWVGNHPGESILGQSRYHRPYQALMTRCQARRKVFRAGRQIGKSEALAVAILYNMFTKPGKTQDDGFDVIVIAPYQSQVDLVFKRLEQLIKSNPGTTNALSRYVKAPMYTMELNNKSIIKGFSCVAGTQIVTSRGLVNIEDVTLKDRVLSKQEDNNLTFLPVTYVYAPNYKDVYRVVLNSGHEVTVSEDHPFWTKNQKWIALKELTVGDHVAIANDFKFPPSSAQPDRLAYLLGLILGDGNITKKTLADGRPRFTSKNPLIQKQFEDTLAELKIGYRSQIHSVTGSKEYTLRKRMNVPHRRCQDKPYTELTALIYKYGLNDKTSINKFIPQVLINESSSIRLGLLKGLLETDGFLQSDGTAGFCSISKELVFGVRNLLNSFGIKAHIRCKKQAGKDTPIATNQRVIHSRYDLYKLCIKSKAYTRKLLDLVDLSAKGICYEKCLEACKNTRDVDVADISYNKIRSIEPIGKATTYDLSVGDGTNNFVANGIVLHNTAGTKSGGNAAAVRGQHADLLVFDEADYLAVADMDAALSIITNYPNASVWMSSTPSGKREKFFQTCFSTLWKEFYFPSSVNPMWNTEMEQMYKEQLTELGYIHEALAEFGEQEQGVFQNAYIQHAKSPYRYGSIPYTQGWKYTIGVDWNDTKIGTSIVVLGFNPVRNIFQVVDRCIVSKVGWTQLAACQKIAELNRIWRPIAIYIDSGYGSTQWEVLRKYGYDSAADGNKGRNHPDARLKDIVHKYEFGGTIETRDLFTKQPIKKPAKAWLVESTVRRFESGDIKFSDSDEELERQLSGYIIQRKTTAGVPVYGALDESIGDHTLDGLMLSVVAFTMELTPFGKPKYSADIAFSGQFGEKSLPDQDISLTMKSDERQKPNSKPEMSRTVGIEKTSLLGVNQEMPGAHLVRETSVGLWYWPGFGHDQPRPKIRSLAQAERDAQMKFGLRPRIKKPQRKNI